MTKERKLIEKKQSFASSYPSNLARPDRNTHNCIFIKAATLNGLRELFFSCDMHSPQCAISRYLASTVTFLHGQTFSKSAPQSFIFQPREYVNIICRLKWGGKVSGCSLVQSIVKANNMSSVGHQVMVENIKKILLRRF